MIAPVLLSVISLALTGHHVAITCTTDSGFDGFATEAQQTVAPQIWVSQAVCAGVKRGDGVSTWVFLHEVGHTTGIASEHLADCYAKDRLRGVLRRFVRESLRRTFNEYRDAITYNAQLGDPYGCVR